MIKSNQCEFSLSQQDFNMRILNDSKTGVSGNTISSGSNTVVGILISHDISLYFGHGFHGKSQWFYRYDQSIRTDCNSFDIHDIVQPSIMLISVVFILQ